MRRPKHRGFSLIELLIVVAIILVIAAIAIPNFLRSRMAANQASAAQSLRIINSAETTYSSTWGIGYSNTLAALAPPTGGSLASPTAADLLDNILAAGNKSGYNFVYTPGSPDAQGHYYGYTLNANPANPGMSGISYYFTDQTYVIRSNGAATASASDSPIS